MRSSLALITAILWYSTVLVSCRKDVFICSNEYGEPSISDIVTNLIPDEIPAAALLSEDSQHLLASAMEHLHMGNVSVYSLVEKVAKLTLPVKSFVSDGLFTLTYASAKYSYTFNDVHFIYKKGFALGYVCSYELIGDTFSSLCNCGGGLLSVGKYSSDQYCVRNSICSDKSVAEGVCKVIVNPFEEGCLLISVRSETTTSEEVQEIEDLVRGSVVFELVVPTLYNIWDTFTSFVPSGATPPIEPTPAEHRWKGSPQPGMLDLTDKVVHNTTMTLHNLPLYPVNLVLGYLLVANARDLTDAPLVRVIMQSIYGLFLAFIVLAYLLYRMSKRVMGRYGGPMAELAHIPLSFSILSMTLANPQILRTFFLAALQFWHTGAPFGVWWLGKAYFLGCMAVCIGLCRYFALFQPDTASWHAMHYSIKLAGLLFLGHSTSCTVLAAVLVLLGSVEDHLRHWMWLAYISSSAVASKPTYKYLAQKKMTMAEAEALGKTHTKIALQQLRTHLEEHPAALDMVLDKFREGGKKDEAQLVSRFVSGKYPGVPYTVESDIGEGAEGNGWSTLFMIFVGAVLVAVGAVAIPMVQASQKERNL